MSQAKPVPEGIEKPKRLYGFQLISRERVREIAAMGGRRAHQLGTAHTFTSEEAKKAGAKGGAKKSANRRKAKEK